MLLTVNQTKIAQVQKRTDTKNRSISQKIPSQKIPSQKIPSQKIPLWRSNNIKKYSFDEKLAVLQACEQARISQKIPSVKWKLWEIFHFIWVSCLTLFLIILGMFSIIQWLLRFVGLEKLYAIMDSYMLFIIGFPMVVLIVTWIQIHVFEYKDSIAKNPE